MAVPSSGSISMRGIFSEKNEDDYGAANMDGETGLSLRGLSNNSFSDTSSGGNINLNSSYATTASGGANLVNAPYAMSEFRGYNHDEVTAAFPSGSDSSYSWFQQTGGLGGEAPRNSGGGAWGSSQVTSSSFAQAGCNIGFQKDTSNNRMAMRYSTFNSSAASSFTYEYLSYSGHGSTTFQAKVTWSASTTGFGSGITHSQPTGASASGSYRNVSTSTYTTWQWTVQASSPASGTAGMSAFSTNGPKFFLRAGTTNSATELTSQQHSLSLSATRGTGGGFGGGGGDFCIHEDHKISTNNGLVDIDTLVDSVYQVWSWNNTTGQKELCDLLAAKTIEHDNLYKINNMMATEDHIFYKENYVPASVNPVKTKEVYDRDVAELAVGDKLMKEDGTLETITNIAVHSGTYKTYTVGTKLGNFYADGILVDSEI